MLAVIGSAGVIMVACTVVVMVVNGIAHYELL